MRTPADTIVVSLDAALAREIAAVEEERDKALGVLTDKKEIKQAKGAARISIKALKAAARVVDNGLHKSNKRLRRALERIAAQFPRCPEGHLMFAVLEQSIKDFVRGREHALNAALYLGGEMVHAERCGVDSDWVRRVLADANCPVPTFGYCGEIR